MTQEAQSGTDWESALITAVIQNTDIRTAIRQKITTEFFYTPIGKSAWKYLLDYYNNPHYGDTPSWELFMDEFTNFEASVVDESVTALCDKVRQTRLYSDLASVIKAVADNTQADPTLGMATLKEQTARIVAEHTVDQSVDVRSMVDQLRDEYYAMQADPDCLKGYPYPWEALNNATLGAQRGQVIFYYARPKSGKTWKGLLTVQKWHAQGLRPIIFSQELSNLEIARRYVALATGVNYADYLRGRLPEEKEAEFMQNLDIFAETQPVIIDTITGRAEQALIEMSAKIDEHGANVVLVDGVYYLGADWKELTTITRGFKAMAKAKDIVILGTTQAGRKKGDDGSEVGYSDTFLQDCDLLVKIVREPQHKKAGTSMMFTAAVRDGMDTAFEVNFKLCEDLTQSRELNFEADEDATDETAEDAPQE